mmetsp:Transcript_10632/g.17474  ORF Transcript_10632/g.17474 Transcript_10632/m.17474 type:complete len:311 (-) Transcript_10632:162-1094(-)
MYDTLRPDLITATRKQRKAMTRDPTEVICFDLFEQNQFPYLEVRRPFIVGTAANQWKATLSHFFLAILHQKNKLKRLYTQNIDGLDLQIGLPADKLVHVHGTIGEASCEFCSAPFEGFKDAVVANIKNIYDSNDPDAPKESSNILCKSCSRPGVKPNTVMYGRNLPDKFFDSCEEDFPQAVATTNSAISDVDLLLVVGTSLTVSPANSLVYMVPADCPRVVVNTIPVGEDMGLNFTNDDRDYLFRGKCDQVFLDLAVQLGWEDELFRYFDDMSPQGQAMIEEFRRKSRLTRPAPSTDNEITLDAKKQCGP